jgi:lysyl-tRNA synthetase class 2
MSKPVFTTRSSTIHRVDYDEKEKVMEIEFRSGNVYRYYDVPPRMWKIFQLYIECEGSAGSFFNEYIKNQFTSEKIAPSSSGGEALAEDFTYPNIFIESTIGFPLHISFIV